MQIVVQIFNDNFIILLLLLFNITNNKKTKLKKKSIQGGIEYVTPTNY